MDGDSPAVNAYTEARMRRISDDLLADINKDTVDFTLNRRFPGRAVGDAYPVPNLLINGAWHRRGHTTNMMPHNLSEVVDGTINAMLF